MRTHLRRVNPRVEGAIGLFLILLGLLLFLLFFTSCTRLGSKFGRAQKQTQEATRKSDEDTRKFAKASVDAIQIVHALAPANPPLAFVNALAIGIKYGELTLRGVGLPVVSVDVAGEVRGDKVAVAEAIKLEKASDLNMAARNELAEAELERLRRLATLGEKAENERNQNIVKRVWKWSIATFGVGGLIALCVFFPVIIPILGRILGWIVSLVPKLAGLIGVVSTKAVDKIVGSVELAKRNNSAARYAIEDIASRKMDEPEKALVRARKPIVMKEFSEDEKEKSEVEAEVSKIVEETAETIRVREAKLGGAKTVG